MAHGTRINGTSYGITGGKCLVNGTAYSIKKGRVFINGSVMDIVVGGKSVTITGITGDSRPKVSIDGTNIYQDGVYEINDGSVINLSMEYYRSPVKGRVGIYLDGIRVDDKGLFTLKYVLTAQGSYDIVYIDDYDLCMDITTK